MTSRPPQTQDAAKDSPPMETDALTRLLSGTSVLAPRLCRAGLSVLTAVRLGSLALGAKTLWKDEVADLRCEPPTQGCLLACFDRTFPLSPFNLFLLQMASVGTHAVACALLFRPPDCQGKDRSGWGLFRSKSHQLSLHWLSLLAKILLEGVFLATFHSLYGRYPASLSCPPSSSCAETTLCTIQKADRKDAFNLVLAGASWLSVALCFVALYPASTDVLCRASNPTKRRLERPLVVHRA
ncbi:gap junction beta-3 protein [Pogona vitticeps]